jgi:HlyD family secretion protein
MSRTIKRILGALFLLALAAGVALVFRPKPLEVETGPVTRGPMQVTIDEDADTRAHDRFTLAAPVAGQLSRISLHEGDKVMPGTVIATIHPLPVDPREEAETRARVESAQALQREADAQVARIQTNLDQAQRDLSRAQALAKEGIIARQVLEEAESKAASLAKEMEAAKQRVQSAAAEVRRAEAGLITFSAQKDQQGKITTVRAPVESRVLRIFEQSARVVAAGTPLLVLSNPNKIEIVVDVLSTDAVKVKPGDAVRIENWGGPKPLRAVVRTVEPYGFTKVSALGIEEQRVNVIADFVDRPDGLGDGYRVDARIVTWESGDALRVPASALFRVGDQWNAFVVEAGRARQVRVEVGHRNPLEAEILSGLQQGEEVVLHPSNELKDGMRIAPRTR